ncbi:hypothetical protein M2324_001640 [Rhodovulum sulfidophilum]|uniref:hypothetical protein n=1 Tax=Rhodovulum sulfidophilum TaxID=35806 RepID=UPI0005A5E0BC|nr:hypothetical protein [Rhodovulum sulfidophilum]ANB32751.1 hypothetical protein A6W98_00865 [Rhodovulum sulfidophilum DSM 1374]ANB36600.1 hypothetical protein A6024_00850 [Rhodovulum sulfidophilum]MCW2303247.1 hypothetical protein [Rhodovulum sulfidophilum]
MPQGPQGEKSPADVSGNALYIVKIAIGEIEETTLKQPAKRPNCLADAKVYADRLSKVDRREVVKLVTEARWKK